MGRMKIDLHPIARNGDVLERSLKEAFEEALEKRVRWLEIIHGKGSGQLKKRVLKFLERKEHKERYNRIVKDKDNSGRLFVHFLH